MDETEDSNVLIAINAGTNKELVVIDTCHELGLFQINENYNDNNRLLDLIWTNDVDMLSCNMCNNPLLGLESHHPALEISIHSEIRRSADKTIDFLDFGNANYDEINDLLNEINCEVIFTGLNLNDDIGKFYEAIYSIINTKIELKSMKHTNHPKWIDSNLINIKKRVNKLHRIMESTNSIDDRKRHSTQRNE